jgi:PTS system galactitol-specific IIB component
MRPVKILIACGGGIATSSYASVEVEKICKDAGIEATITKGKILDVPSSSKNFDICLVTSKYLQEVNCPLFSISALITGIGADELKKDITKTLKEIYKQINN